MASESVMWDYFRVKMEAARVGVERIDAKRVEGVPDVVWCHESSDTAGWIELKVIDRAFGDGVRIPWKSPAQPLWLGNWVRKGGRAGILLRDAEDSWWYWKADVSAAWHKAMLSRELPRSSWRSVAAFNAGSFVDYLTD